MDRTPPLTREGLVELLVALASAQGAEEIRTMDYRAPRHLPRFGHLVRDHDDHLATARMAEAAHRAYRTPHRLVGYAGYGVSALPAVVEADQLLAKTQTLRTYAEHDPAVDPASQAYSSCLVRQYRVGAEHGGSHGRGKRLR
ncbi:MAG: hypothetical protein ACYCXA_14750 [Actinomycetes bacterium]